MAELSKRDPDKLLYLDEAGLDDNDCYDYAWGLKGKRVYAMKNANRAKRLSMISTIRKSEHIAPFIFEGSCNREVFETYIEKVLKPTLIPGHTLILDNASFHKGGRIRKMIEEAGCEILYLAPYSPDYNPIEHHWFSIKHRIKQEIQHCANDIYQAATEAFNFVSI